MGGGKGEKNLADVLGASESVQPGNSKGKNCWPVQVTRNCS